MNDARNRPSLLLRPLRTVAFLAFGCSVLLSHAQQEEDASAAAERARLKDAREKVEATYKVEEKACYGKFAVTDCLARARAKRREALSDLRRQELALNDAERKRKAAERQRSIDERAAAARAPASQPQDADRLMRANERAANRQAQAASAPAKAAEREQLVRQKQAQAQAAAQRRAEEAAKNVQERERRQAEARQREAAMKQRLAERKKPAASSLADPP